MTEKKAFVFDTNFIIQHHNLDEALDKIKEQFAIYITQVSIDERIAQNCREVKTQFSKAEECKAEFASFATVQFKKTYEEVREHYKRGIQRKYESYFDNNIIPYAKDGEMLTDIIERANQKIPPFSSAKDASDKGFKDCLLWLSMLAYFKDKGEEQIIFVTDDKSAFRNNTEFLQEEFHNVTGKTIEIHPNTFFKELLTPSEEEPVEEAVAEELPGLDSFREEVEGAIEGLLGVYDEDYYGNSLWLQAFTISAPFDNDYVKIFFGELKNTIEKHLFEKALPASTVFNSDGRVTDSDTEIPMKNLEESLRVYKAVLASYPQYREQFFEAAARILNRNYKAPTMFQAGFAEDEELPF